MSLIAFHGHGELIPAWALLPVGGAKAVGNQDF